MIEECFTSSVLLIQPTEWQEGKRAVDGLSLTLVSNSSKKSGAGCSKPKANGLPWRSFPPPFIFHDFLARHEKRGGRLFQQRARLVGHMPSVTKKASKSSQPDASPQSFETLYRDHVDQIYRYAHRLCGEAESAKDLVQETFLNAYRGLKGFRGEARVSTWLYTIASRACMRMRRKRKGEPEHELSLDEFIPTSEGELRLQIPIDGLTPEEALQNKQLREALDRAINQLPKKYRMTLVLRDMEGLSAKEVGAIMGANERAVKSRLHRARLFVRKELSARGLSHENHQVGGERGGTVT